MSTVKRQHYVPRFYLKRFTRHGSQLYVFDKSTGKSFPSNIENVATEAYFYDMPQDRINAMEQAAPQVIAQMKIQDPQIQEQILLAVSDPQYMEKLLASYESRGSSVLREFLNRVERKRSFRRKHRSAIAFFMAVQIVRSPVHRLESVQIREKGYKAILDDGLFANKSTLSPDEYYVKMTKDSETVVHLESMRNADLLASIGVALSEHLWWVGINGTKLPFYTSDAPVISRGHLGGQGLASAGIEVSFPLSPTRILVLAERTAFTQYRKYDGRTMVLNEDHVEYYNSLQVFQSYRQIYCSENELGLAKKIYVERPEIRAINRDRIMVE